ncbi:MAG: hypothetical protein AAGI52_05425 [Bacteroidota bacterium]
MTDGLSVIRRVAAGAPDDSPEAAILTQSLAALDSLPSHAPDADVVARIVTHAAEASDLERLAAVRGAMGLGPIQNSAEGAILAQSVSALDTLPPESPAPQTVAAVEADAEAATFAAVRAMEQGATVPTPEGELLRQSVAALNALPAYSPSDDALAAVFARAEAESSAPILAAFGDAPSDESPEAVLLAQSVAALDSLPSYAPSEDTLAAVLAHAHAASVAPVLAAYGEAEMEATPEMALLTQSREALDTLPSYAPGGEALAAVLAAAAVHTSGGASARPRRRATDRGAVVSGRTGVWAGMATLAVAVIAAVVFLRPPAELAPAQPETVEEVPAEVGSFAEAALALPETDPDAAGVAPPVVATPEQQIPVRRAPRGPSAEGVTPVVERRAPDPVASAPAQADLVAEADDDLTEAATNWDAGDDLRLLSLRLRQLREQNEGVGWDTPSVAFGDAGSDPAGTTPGVQAVREGPPAGAIRMRSLPTDTTSRQ